jgi:hypothetical protein
MTSFNIYWLVKLDDIRSMLNGEGLLLLVVLITLASMVMWVFHLGNNSSEDSFSRAIVKSIMWPRRVLTMVSIFAILVITLGQALIPSTKQMAVIIVVPKIVNSAIANEELKKLPGKLIELSGEWMEELRPQNVKSVVESIAKPDLKTNIKQGETQ